MVPVGMLFDLSRCFHHAKCVILVYDATNRQSFESLRKVWLPQIDIKCGIDSILKLLGELFTKSDINFNLCIASFTE